MDQRLFVFCVYPNSLAMKCFALYILLGQVFMQQVLYRKFIDISMIELLICVNYTIYTYYSYNKIFFFFFFVCSWSFSFSEILFNLFSNFSMASILSFSSFKFLYIYKYCFCKFFIFSSFVSLIFSMFSKSKLFMLFSADSNNISSDSYFS